jgi:hypothetical protein
MKLRPRPKAEARERGDLQPPETGPHTVLVGRLEQVPLVLLGDGGEDQDSGQRPITRHNGRSEVWPPRRVVQRTHKQCRAVRHFFQSGQCASLEPRYVVLVNSRFATRLTPMTIRQIANSGRSARQNWPSAAMSAMISAMAVLSNRGTEKELEYRSAFRHGG